MSGWEEGVCPTGWSAVGLAHNHLLDKARHHGQEPLISGPDGVIDWPFFHLHYRKQQGIQSGNMFISVSISSWSWMFEGYTSSPHRRMSLSFPFAFLQIFKSCFQWYQKHRCSSSECRWGPVISAMSVITYNNAPFPNKISFELCLVPWEWSSQRSICTRMPVDLELLVACKINTRAGRNMSIWL